MESPVFSSSSRISSRSDQPSSSPRSLFEHSLTMEAVEEEAKKSRIIWDFLDQQWRPFSDLPQLQMSPAVSIELNTELHVVTHYHDEMTDSLNESSNESRQYDLVEEENDSESDGPVFQFKMRKRANRKSIQSDGDSKESDTDECSRDSDDSSRVKGLVSVAKEQLPEGMRQLSEPSVLPKLKLRRVNGKFKNISEKTAVGCKKCEPQKTFTSTPLLQEHEELHHSDRHQFVCPICAKAFTKDDGRKRHIRKVHHVMQKKMAPRLLHECRYCKKEFSEKFNRDRHERTHDDKNKELFRCGICSKTFSQKSNLTV
uniref:C2H2-type domain-containing protein n=1 Tax=Plectus sambesii TaxID=2011161 RepID=A0A914VY91_9BILA